MKKKKIISILCIIIIAALLCGCSVQESQARMQALGFAERITGTKYYTDELEVKEIGHAVEETYYTVTGTVLSGEERKQSRFSAHLEYDEDEDTWMLNELTIDGEEVY